jgi:hypothetical protein
MNMFMLVLVIANLAGSDDTKTYIVIDRPLTEQQCLDILITMPDPFFYQEKIVVVYGCVPDEDPEEHQY